MYLVIEFKKDKQLHISGLDQIQTIALFSLKNSGITEPCQEGSGQKPANKRTKFYDEAEQKCSECDFVANKRLLLKKHCILKHAETMDAAFLLNHYKCDFCDKVFKDPIQLSNHKNVHLGLKPYKCVECEHMFTTRGELIRHTRYK